jgi:hypothetical protein
MTIKIEIPSGAEFKPLAVAIGEALVKYGGTGVNISTSNAVTVEESEAITEAVKTSLAETATEQDSSTVTQNSEVATASSQSSNVVNLESAAGNITDTTQSSAQSQEQSAAQQDVGAARDALGNDVTELDEKGVGKNAQFCGNAAKPFYGSGKMQGQWKKRQGVDQPVYDEWYTASLALVTPLQVDTAEQQIDTSAAFQNGEQVPDGQNHQPQGAGGLTFADAGAFMQWLSEQQAAELITAGDIDSAYQATGNSMGDLFDPSKAANAIAQVYNFLSNIAEGQQ